MATVRKDPPALALTFEHSLQRLEQIVEQLESGELPLEESLKVYEEGIALSKTCVETLNKAELRLKKLKKDMKGNFQLVDGEPDEE